MDLVDLDRAAMDSPRAVAGWRRCDPRLAGVLLQIRWLQAEIIAALASLGAPPSNGH